MGNLKYKRLVAGFFAAMLVLTLLSRVADSFTVPKAYTLESKQGTLVYNTSAEGKIIASDQQYVRPEKGLFIEKIHVGEGQAVKAGDVLFSMDLEYIDEQLLQAQQEIAVLRLELRKAELSGGAGAAELAAVEKARSALARAQADGTFNTELNGGKQLLADKRAIEDAAAELAAAEKQQTESKEKSGLDLELKQLELQEKERAAKKLLQISQNGGNIRAEIAGTVGQLKAEAGTETNGEILCSLVPVDAEYICEVELADEDAKYIKNGDEVSITLPGKGAPLTGLTVRSVQSSGGKTKVSVAIPAEKGVSNGMTVSFSHSSAAQSYSCTIPIEALRGDKKDYFVLVAEDVKTVLGKEQKAVRIAVNVLATDTKSAALADQLPGRIIRNSSKPVVPGDRVREVPDEVQ